MADARDVKAALAALDDALVEVRPSTAAQARWRAAIEPRAVRTPRALAGSLVVVAAAAALAALLALRAASPIPVPSSPVTSSSSAPSSLLVVPSSSSMAPSSVAPSPVPPTPSSSPPESPALPVASSSATGPTPLSAVVRDASAAALEVTRLRDAGRHAAAAKLLAKIVRGPYGARERELFALELATLQEGPLDDDRAACRTYTALLAKHPRGAYAADARDAIERLACSDAAARRR